MTWGRMKCDGVSGMLRLTGGAADVLSTTPYLISPDNSLGNKAQRKGFGLPHERPIVCCCIVKVRVVLAISNTSACGHGLARGLDRESSCRMGFLKGEPGRRTLQKDSYEDSEKAETRSLRPALTALCREFAR